MSFSRLWLYNSLTCNYSLYLRSHMRWVGLFLDCEGWWCNKVDSLVSSLYGCGWVDSLGNIKVGCSLLSWGRIEFHLLGLQRGRRGHHLGWLLTLTHLLAISNWGKHLLLISIRSGSGHVCGARGRVIVCSYGVGVELRNRHWRLKLCLLLRLLRHEVMNARLLLTIVHVEITELICSRILLVLNLLLLHLMLLLLHITDAI